MFITIGTVIYDSNKAAYNVLEFIGKGAFGDVYKIEKNDDKSIWALKTLPTTFQDKNNLKSLIHEGNQAIKISHQNFIKYIFFHDGSLFPQLPPYIIMEFADQGTLENVIIEQKRKNEFIPNGELQKYFNQLINGMDAVNLILIHRDIKPNNILIKKDLLKISDFGLSKIIEEETRTSTFKGIGHVKYMSPEGWKNQTNTIQMDIYSMGVVFFELATLCHPLEVKPSDGFQEWRDAHLYQNPKRPNTINTNLSPAFSQVIFKMIEKSVSNRFKSWTEIKAELAKENLPVTSNTPLVDAILNKRLEKDSMIKEEQLKKQKRQKEIEDFYKLVEYQIKKDIYEPLDSFIKELNERYTGSNKVILHNRQPGRDFNCLIGLPSGNPLALEIRPLIDEEFNREKEIDDYGRTIRVRRLERPLWKNKKIMAWGYLKSKDGKGFNVILVEKDNDAYGEWVILTNTNNALVKPEARRNVEPFPFEFREMEKEIKFASGNVTHIYVTKAEQLKINHFVNFIEEYI
ncbi:MAG: serine/threonine protein kinase [Planctomycetes bacterium]|nr:serine/threonine protein kinase [Planctomycetota bacterium]